MEFVVLKVNGRDVSPSEAARALRASDEPLIVTLKRIKLAAGSPPLPATTPASPPSPSATPAATPANAAATAATTATATTTCSTGTMTSSVEVQTDDLWSDWGNEDADGAPERSLHDILEQDIDLEEVTLVRGEVAETLGITLSCSCSSGSDDLDTEVYIAAVEPTSLAGRDGRLQRGDQILQVNGEDVTTRELAEHMFNSPASSITLLVSRYYSEEEADDDELVEACPRPSCGKPIGKPRTPTHAKQFHHSSGRDTPDDGSTDRRSDGSSDRRSDGSTDRRSDTSTDRRSDCSDTTATTAYINVQPAPPPPKQASANGLPPASAAPTSASVRRKESSKRANGEAADGAPATTTTTSSSSRRSQRTLPSNGAASATAAASAPGSRSTTRSLPGSLPGVAAHPLRAPSSEHIYETIPESDSEHIYCEPYEPAAEYTNVVNAQAARPLLTLQLRNGREDRGTLRLGSMGLSSQSSARQTGSSSGPCSTMYTNAANLQHTIEVQQELFRQSLRQTTPTSSSRPPLPLPSPSSGGRHRSSSSNNSSFPPPPVCTFPPPPCGPGPGPMGPMCPAAPAPSDAKMEWKVKRRADGSRYITRRPVRTRVIREALRDRAAQLRDERAGFSTEDDTASELKMGRYWTKAERKQHVRRRRQQQSTLEQLDQPKQGLHVHGLHGLHGQVEEDAGRRQAPVNAVEAQPSHKKMVRKKSNLSNVDDFTTVQELLAQGSRATVNGKMLGLLSVTTV